MRQLCPKWRHYSWDVPVPLSTNECIPNVRTKREKVRTCVYGDLSVLFECDIRTVIWQCLELHTLANALATMKTHCHNETMNHTVCLVIPFFSSTILFFVQTKIHFESDLMEELNWYSYYYTDDPLFWRRIEMFEEDVHHSITCGLYWLIEIQD